MKEHFNFIICWPLAFGVLRAALLALTILRVETPEFWLETFKGDDVKLRKDLTHYYEILYQQDDAQELAALRAFGLALATEDEAAGHLYTARQTLEAGLALRYRALTPEEVQVLVVDDKWLATLHQGLSHELARLSSTLARHLTELAQRYAQPLPALEADVTAHQARVNTYLAQMGFSAN